MWCFRTQLGGHSLSHPATRTERVSARLAAAPIAELCSGTTKAEACSPGIRKQPVTAISILKRVRPKDSQGYSETDLLRKVPPNKQEARSPDFVQNQVCNILKNIAHPKSEQICNRRQKTQTSDGRTQSAGKALSAPTIEQRVCPRSSS